MPAVPEFRDAAGDIGIIEILQEVKPKHPAQPDCHITVAGKIKIDLQHETDRRQPV